MSPDDGFTEDELRFLQGLHDAGIRFMVIGLAAALLQGADAATEDIDLWLEGPDAEKLRALAQSLGGFFTDRSDPPMVGGAGLDRFDIVTYRHGLGSFEDELEHVVQLKVGGVEVPVLGLQRIVASKRAAGRPKDQAILLQLETALGLLRLRTDQGEGS